VLGITRPTATIPMLKDHCQPLPRVRRGPYQQQATPTYTHLSSPPPSAVQRLICADSPAWLDSLVFQSERRRWTFFLYIQYTRTRGEMVLGVGVQVARCDGYSDWQCACRWDISPLHGEEHLLIPQQHLVAHLLASSHHPF